MDTSVWNEGRNDPFSGPKKDTKSFVPGQAPEDTEWKDPEFSFEGWNYAAWIPYGGGPRIYPGRDIAKRQISFIIALVVACFDIDFKQGGRTKADE
ncbi:MAG: hypothetical protein M1820_007094 [Bogoriella megaspora]|nr:MAG: hypothetical protein M1820_007094 [Bogoriella megaspora]